MRLGRLRIAASVGCNKRVRHRIALDIEPAPASCGMAPLLAMRAPGVRAHEQVIAPLFVAAFVRTERPRDVRLATVAEVAFRPRPAPWATNQQHRIAAFAA